MRCGAAHLSGVCVAFLSFAIALAPAGAGYDSAYAKNEKSADKGDNGRGDERGNSGGNKNDNGNRNGNRNGNGRDKQADRGASQPGAAKGSTRAKSKPWWLEDPEEKPGSNRSNRPSTDAVMMADDLGPARALGTGSLSGQMGALNAAHANSRALERASSGSRVGRIAAYKAGLEDLSAVQSDLNEALEELDGLEPPDRDLADIRTDLRTARTEVRRLEDEIEKLEADLKDAGGSDEAIEADLEEARNDLAEAREDRRAAKSELDAAIDYRNAVEEVTELQAELNLTEAEALSLLEAAANKPLTNDVIAEVNRLLGLEDIVLLLPEETEDETGSE